MLDVVHTHLIGTRNDAWELAFLFILALYNGFDDAGVVRSQVYEAVGDAGLYGKRINIEIGLMRLMQTTDLPDGLEKGKGSGVHPARQSAWFCVRGT